MLQAKYLMIGDWIKTRHGDYARIAECYHDNSIFTKDGEYEGEHFKVGEFEAIPLTSEILEKNGFKYTNDHTLKGADTYVLKHEQRGFYYIITIKLNDWFAVDSLDDRVYKIFEMWIGRWHVHQLQHALRLCGIEKEIKL